jgi:hypothetical protein
MQHIKPYKQYKIYLTRMDQSWADPEIYSWEAFVMDDNNNCIMRHYFSLDDVRWGGYTVDYMFKRMMFDIDTYDSQEW